MDKHAHVRHPKELIQEAKNRRRRNNRLLYYNDLSAEVDHETLTYLAELQDEQMTELKGIAEILRNLKAG
jgi:ferritin